MAPGSSAAPAAAPAPKAWSAPRPAAPEVQAKSTSHILDVIDKMMAAPAAPKAPEAARSAHAGAVASMGTAPAPSLGPGPRVQTVTRSDGPKDPLDEAADLFKVVFKGEIIP